MDTFLIILVYIFTNVLLLLKLKTINFYSVFSTVITICFVCNESFGISYDYVNFIYILSIILFFIPFYTITCFGKPIITKPKTISYSKCNKYVKIYFIVAIVEFVINIISILRFANYSLLYYLRNPDLVHMAYLNRSTSIIDILVTMLNWFSIINIIIIAFLFGKKKNRHKLISVISVSLKVFAGLFLMSKMSILVPIIIFIFAFLISTDLRKNMKKIVKLVLLFGIVGYGALVVIGLQRHYDVIYQENIFVIVLKKALSYFYGSIEAFGAAMEEGFISGNGVYSLRPFASILNLFGAKINTDLHLGFVDVSFGNTNVYGMIGLFYMDFGLSYVIMMMIVLGTVCGLLSVVSNKGLAYYVFSSIMYMVLVMSFYTFMFAQTYLIIIIIISFCIQNKFLVKENIKHENLRCSSNL